MRDRAMALVAGHVAQRGAELLAPEHGLALISGWPK
jgi:hypothetical protein